MKNLIKIFLLLFLILPCNSFNIFYTQRNDIINNIAIDFTKKGKGKKNKTYEIIELQESNKLFSFLIIDEPIIYISSKDSIGTVSKYFPTKYKEINKRLYIWNDSTVVISKELILKLKEYKVIDSTIYKIEKGELSNNQWPILKTDESKKKYFYYVCKNNISKYVKKWTNKVEPVENYPTIDCESAQ